MTNPVDIACIYGHYETIFALVNVFGITKNAIIIATKNNHTNLVIDLIKSNNLNVNEIKDEFNNTLLCITSSIGNLDLTERLIVELNANVNIRNRNGNSPLMLATIKDKLSMVELLIENGAKLNLLNNFGY